jgi:hypothetical protein
LYGLIDGEMLTEIFLFDRLGTGAFVVATQVVIREIGRTAVMGTDKRNKHNFFKIQLLINGVFLPVKTGRHYPYITPARRQFQTKTSILSRYSGKIPSFQNNRDNGPLHGRLIYTQHLAIELCGHCRKTHEQHE